MINPRLFRPDYQIVDFPDKPTVFYLAVLNLQGVKYPTRKIQQFKTAKKARRYALHVIQRWYRLYDAAVLQPAVEPTPAKLPAEA